MTGEKNDPLPPLSTTRSPNDGYGTSKGEKGMLDDGINSSSSVFDLKEGDEALQLVGAVRTAEFSDTFNAQLRRRLVSFANLLSYHLPLSNVPLRTSLSLQYVQQSISPNTC